VTARLRSFCPGKGLVDMANTWDVAVIGAGPIGSSAARHFAKETSVVIIGPAEPDSFRDHDGLWAGSYDEGRAGHLVSSLVSSIINRRSMMRFPELEAETGASFSRLNPFLTVSPQDREEELPQYDLERLLQLASDLGVRLQLLSGEQLRQELPRLRFRKEHVGTLETNAMLVNPRGLVRAQLESARAHGAAHVVGIVTSLKEHAGYVDVSTQDGQEFRASRVLVTSGPLTNACQLLPRKLAMEAYGVTIVLVEADPEKVAFPTTLYKMCESGRVEWRGIIVPPLLYPDGHWYVKGAGGGEHLKPLDELKDFKEWVRTGGSRDAAESFRAVLNELMPDWSFGPAQTKPCMSSHNVVDAPYIDFVTERLAVATACDHGVAGAVEIGRLAARMLIDMSWSDSLPREAFCAQFQS
jgi:sarcosine oxidase